MYGGRYALLRIYVPVSGAETGLPVDRIVSGKHYYAALAPAAHLHRRQLFDKLFDRELDIYYVLASLNDSSDPDFVRYVLDTNPNLTEPEDADFVDLFDREHVSLLFVQIFIDEYGKDINVVGRRGHGDSPLWRAVNRVHPKIALFLLDRGAEWGDERSRAYLRGYLNERLAKKTKSVQKAHPPPNIYRLLLEGGRHWLQSKKTLEMDKA